MDIDVTQHATDGGDVVFIENPQQPGQGRACNQRYWSCDHQWRPTAFRNYISDSDHQNGFHPPYMPLKPQFPVHLVQGDDHAAKRCHHHGADGGDSRGQIYVGSQEGGMNYRHAQTNLSSIIESGALDETIPIKRINIEVKMLDQERFANIGFIKIDVEGHEREVILGGQKLIARDKSVILVEIE